MAVDEDTLDELYLSLPDVRAEMERRRDDPQPNLLAAEVDALLEQWEREETEVDTT
jgi:hypothetical protein